MSTNEPMPQEQLDSIREREWAAAEGPWAPWLDQDGQPHMQGRLMVGVAAGVIPDGETWVEGPGVNNPVAETYTPEDRVFIAHAREDIPALLAEVERLRDELAKAREVTDDMIERAALVDLNMGLKFRGLGPVKSLEEIKPILGEEGPYRLRSTMRAALIAVLGGGKNV